MLTARGYGDSRVVALEHMGGPHEARHEALAKDWGDGPVADLNTLAVECVAAPDARVFSRVAGLPDDAFEHDGKMTKREVRAATLAALAPMRAGGRTIGIENNPDRMAMAARNAALLGVPELALISGEAPAALEGLDAPDAVFVGGGIGTDGLFEACWSALKPGGRLVANTVTIEGESTLARFHREHGGDMVRLAVSRLSPVGRLHGWKPLMTVTQWQAVK
jgi:precorrin-6Y C5,15-methyltransferase (decarboxylating)